MKPKFTIRYTGPKSAYVYGGKYRVPIEWRTEEQKRFLLALAKAMLAEPSFAKAKRRLRGYLK